MHFLHAKLNPDAADENGVTLLLYAIRRLNLKAAEMLLNEGANPFIISKSGQCAAGVIARIEVDALQQMVAEWGNSSQSLEGSAEAWPVVQGVCRAAALGDCKQLRELLLSGDSADQRDAWGHTALLLAAVHGHIKAVELLLEQGANPCAPHIDMTF